MISKASSAASKPATVRTRPRLAGLISMATIPSLRLDAAVLTVPGPLASGMRQRQSFAPYARLNVPRLFRPQPRRLS